MQPCPPHGHGERRFSTRPYARIFHLTISLLLAFLANCEKPQPLSTQPSTPAIVPFVLKVERDKLERFRMETEKAKESNSINESEYKRRIKEYEQGVEKNKAAFKALKPGN